MSREVDGLLLRNAVLAFAVDGDLLSIQPLKRRHIHDTFVSTWRRGGALRRFLHQRMNDKVCLLYTSPSPRDRQKSRMPSSA